MAQIYNLIVTDAMHAKILTRAAALSLTPTQYVLRRIRQAIIGEEQQIFIQQQEVARAATMTSSAATADSAAATATAANLATLNSTL
jgi:hypothetical protein